MKKQVFRRRWYSAVLLATSLALALPSYPSVVLSQEAPPRSDSTTIVSRLAPAPEMDGFVYAQADGRILCRPATPSESRAMTQRDPELPLTVISQLTPSAVEPREAGLQIVLRATPQLDSFPQAKAAFIAAAEAWQQLVASPITIIIDVDFGPTRFGSNFQPGVLGATLTQALIGTDIYSEVRQGLIDRASSPDEAALYGLLPESEISTDDGPNSNIVASSALFRAIGILNAVADPSTEPVATFGSPPSIGFNSAFSYDFDPSDGIDADKIDFDGVAFHEIGHAMGFVSGVGRARQQNATPALTPWDLFRVGPGVALGTFPTAPRILSPGGDHLFFTGNSLVPLATGGVFSGAEGDGSQSSHWKDADFIGLSIGVMDPTIAFGVRSALTNHDVRAIDLMGHSLMQPPVNTAPIIEDFLADLQGNTLVLTGTAVDPDGDLSQGMAAVLGDDGLVIAVSSRFQTEAGTATVFDFDFRFNLAGFADVFRANLILFDDDENLSAPVTSNFGIADPGGPQLNKVKYNGRKLIIKGTGFTGELAVEVNGVVVAPPVQIKVNAALKKLKIKGNAAALNFTPGANRVRVFNNGARSNIMVGNF